MRISYWSSDVCSSDLARILRGQADDLAILLGPQIGQLVAREEVDKGKAVVLAAKRDRRFHRRRQFHRRGVREFSRHRIGSGGGDGFGFRSEERRVGKEWGSTGRSRWWPFH